MPRTQDDIDIDNLTPVVPVKRDDNYEDPYEFVETPIGRMERWRASPTITAKTQHYIQIRNDAIEALGRLEKELNRADAAIAQSGLLRHMGEQLTAIGDRLEKLEARARADDEAVAKRDAFEQEPLSLPPGDPPGADPIVAADNPADEPPGISKDPGELPEPSLELEDSLGDLPEELRDLPDPVEPPKGQVVQQPVSISLTEE